MSVPSTSASASGSVTASASSSFDSKLFQSYGRLLPLGLNQSESIVYCLRGTNSNLVILATASGKLTAYYLNVDTFEILDEIASYSTWVQRCVLTVDNTLLAVLAEQVIYLYHAKMRYVLLTKFRAHDTITNSLIWTQLHRPLDEQHLITAGKDGIVRCPGSGSLSCRSHWGGHGP
jgi:WD40 repeat protein